jgi:uncharacterized membrane protein
MRRSTDRLYFALGPRELEALRIVAARPGLTVAELREALGVSRGRCFQIVSRLEGARVRREPDR